LRLDQNVTRYSASVFIESLIHLSVQKQLVIIQNRETQFDAPLYALIQARCFFRLLLIYTEPTTTAAQCDQEIGRSPQWDHLITGSYPSRVLASTTPWAIAKLAVQLRRQKPDLVLICGYYPRSQLLLAVFLRVLGQRIGLRSDNTLTHTSFSGWRGRLRRVGVGWIQRLFHTWHPVGEQAHAYLRAISGTQRPCYRFAYAVDNDWFAEHSAQSRNDRPRFLANQGWPQDAYVVLGIMKWNDREDPLTLVAAFQRLLQAEPRARLILIGDGPLRAAVETACQSLGDNVLRPGYVPYSHLPTWYGKADVFVHPSPDEPWGVSVNEAMACGLPVFAAMGVGAAHELIVDGVNGRIVPNRDPLALASALKQLLQNPALAALWGERCRAVAGEWSYVQTIEAFQQAMVP